MVKPLVRTAPTTFVVPLYSSIDASGQAVLEVLQQQKVVMEYDLSFNYVCDEAESAALLNAFQLRFDSSGADATNSPLDVTMRSKPESVAAFKSALTAVISDASNNEMDKYSLVRKLYDQAKSGMNTIFGDGIANILENKWSLSVNVDASGGAANMWADLSGSTDLSGNGPMDALARQIPNANYLAYSDASENIHTDALPLLGDDTIVFLFDVTLATVGLTVTDINQFYNSATPAPTNLPGAATVNATGSWESDLSGSNPIDASQNPYVNDLIEGANTSYGESKQIAAFFVKVTSGDGNKQPIAGLEARSETVDVAHTVAAQTNANGQATAAADAGRNQL